MSSRWLHLPLAFLVCAIDVACSSSSSADVAGAVCCELPSSPPRCGFPLIYGGRKHTAGDGCSLGTDGTIPDPSVAGWTKVSDADGCLVWTPPPGAPTVSCGIDGDAGVGDSGFGCCEIGETPPDCFRGYGRRKTSASDTCLRGAYDGMIPDPTAPGWTKGSGADGCPVWKPPPGAPTFTCGGDAAPPDARVDAPSD